jgi:hypothetical protein
MGCGVLQKYCNSEMQAPSCQIQFIERLKHCYCKFPSGLYRENLGGEIVLIGRLVPLPCKFLIIWFLALAAAAAEVEDVSKKAALKGRLRQVAWPFFGWEMIVLLIAQPVANISKI